MTGKGFKTIALRILIVLIFLTDIVVAQAQHPVAFATKSELDLVKRDLNKYPILQHSFKETKQQVDQWLHKDIDVPYPKDPAGGYTHDRHKENYTLMFNSALLFNLTGEAGYAELVKKLLLKYAILNPTLVKHPQATSSSPGHLFWQALNDANWLVYTGMAYDLVYNYIPASERKIIEQGAFRPEVDFITKDLQAWFDLIHNHGVWACAGVGIVGIATNNQEYIDMALYGTDKKGKSGFIAQMNGLFSPDGYYTEGPYYVRYAILPYFLFANAIDHARPALKVFRHRDSILLKALMAGLEQTNIDGTFFPMNDAMKEKDYTTNEMVSAIDIAWSKYGANPGLLIIAGKQDRVLMNSGGASIAKALASTKNGSATYPYHSVEYTDGVNGKEGGVSLLRSGKGKDLSTSIFKYTSHGLSHGHFDKLNIQFYDKGNEILSDYGSVRFVGIEQKYGGRYLPENDCYAAQTIAHNTLVADEISHFEGKEKLAEKFHSDKLYSSITNPAIQIVAARDTNAYNGIDLQRSVYLLQLPSGKKIQADIFHARSETSHQYDLPFQYKGHLINTSFKYTPFVTKQETLGKKNGYQYIFREAEAKVHDTIAQLTFLNDKTYYTISSLITGDATLFLTRSGANDPDFNLRHEPAIVIRKQAGSTSFLNVLEIHGKFDPVIEFSTNSYPSIQQMEWVVDDENYSIARLVIDGKVLQLAQCNTDYAAPSTHTVETKYGKLTWKGPFSVLYDNKPF